MRNFYFIAGASGSGKTAIISELKKMLGEGISVYDFDDIGVPHGADKKWRQESTEKWLQKLIQENKDACLLGQIVLGEMLACPSFQQTNKINFCLLDVSDFERIQRLKNRNTCDADQNMLNWSSWLRMHHQDPQWMQHVLKEDCWNKLNFNAWDKLIDWDKKANIKILDTTSLEINQVAQSVADWIHQNRNETGELIPNSHYKLYKNSENAAKIIDDALFAFNKKCVPATQEPEIININYIIKEDGVFIAGISAYCYTWKIMHIDLLFVEESHRDHDLGTLLLNQVETDAKKLGVSLIHLDTFDFQAKDFYLKHGYEVFGVLDDCPEKHKRYYLKKILNQYFKSEYVLNLYSKLDNLGIKIWLDGGWGVDALLRKQTRPHSDLDIIIQQQDVLKLRELLISDGYQNVPRDDTSDWNFVLGDDKGHEVDVHVITFNDKGDRIYGPAEKGLFYPAESLLAQGCIDGVTVRCLTPEYQIESHLGYKPSEKDFKDVRALCEKFNIECPKEYQNSKQ
ncbi:MAG: GNAT family N-acetyltransferase [Gammaproteobacteria bacterium]|nr:GNAT family N-acetyltransferase [Gammaproteobacteria bacterium]